MNGDRPDRGTWRCPGDPIECGWETQLCEVERERDNLLLRLAALEAEES